MGMRGCKEKGNEGVKRAHRGSESGCCEQLGVSNPFSQGVGCLHTTCQRLFSTRQQVVGKPNLLAGSRQILLQKGPPWSPWRLPALVSVLPCMKSPVRWHGTPLIAQRSGFSTAVKSPPLVLQGMVGTLSMMAQGQMQSNAWSCKVGGVIGYFPSMAVKIIQRKRRTFLFECAFWTCFSKCNQMVYMRPQNQSNTLADQMWYSFQMICILF